MTRAPSPSVADVLRWRKLVRTARAMAQRPQASGRALGQAAKGCKRAHVPTSFCRPGSCFHRLYVLGLQFPSLCPADRAERAAELGALAALVEAGLSPADTPERKDIFG